MTNRRTFLGAGSALAALSLAGCAGTADGGWTDLFDGKSTGGWSPLGPAKWSVANGVLEGSGGGGGPKAGYLVSSGAHGDFELRVEFWADADCNSGIFIRCQDRAKVGADSSYEVNIWDKAPRPFYSTGSIVNFAAVGEPVPKAADRWNVYEIIARGDRVTVVLNGRQTVDMVNGKFASGPIALQSAGGVIRFRSVKLRAL
jgi:Domain of Unknown Function (DUF1080)